MSNADRRTSGRPIPRSVPAPVQDQSHLAIRRVILPIHSYIISLFDLYKLYTDLYRKQEEEGYIPMITKLLEVLTFWAVIIPWLIFSHAFTKQAIQEAKARVRK
jgi:hypothetical protein